MIESQASPLRQATGYRNAILDRLKEFDILTRSSGDYQGKLTFPVGTLAVMSNITIRQAENINIRVALNESAHKTLTFLDGGMPLSKYEEASCTPDKDPYLPLLTSWPKDIDISDDDKRQFCDVYCL